MSDNNNNNFNKEADFWINEVGANPFPADTKNRKVYFKWGEYQDKSIPVEEHESRKQKGEYNIGIAVMTGPIHKGKNSGKYLIGIDCDNNKAIQEICINKDGKTITLQELANWTRVEQHKDNPNKCHIYILSTKPFKNKSRNIKYAELESLNQIPAIEVKCERQTMFTAPSIHQNGHPYEILGVKEPVLCDEFENHIDNIFRRYGIEYLYQESNNNKNEENNNSSSKLPEPLRQLILLLEIPKDFQFKIHEGSRHNTMISFANSLLFKYKYDTNINRDELKNFFYEANNKLCIPEPLPENEIKTIWRDSLKNSEEKTSRIKIENDDVNDIPNYKSPIVVKLEQGDKLFEREIVQNFVYDLQTDSIDCTLNSKYKPGTRVIVPINIKQWPDVRKTFRKECLEKGIEEEDISLLLEEGVDINVDLIKKYYLENHRKNVAALAAAEERRKQRFELIEEGTKFVMAKFKFLTIEESKDILFYDSSKGVYVYGGEIEIEKTIDKKYGFKLKTPDINEIKNCVTRKTYIKKEVFDSNIDIINLKNGLYNWKTNEFLPHTPDYYSLNQKPIKYNPEAKSTKFIKFLSEVLYQQDIQTAIQIIAYTFIRKNLYEYWFILIGNGANGKNVFVGVVSHLHGLKNITNISLGALVNNRFALSRLENKDINVDTELSTKSYNDISNLKKLTGTQPVTVEPKGKDLYDVELWCKLFFNTNELPVSSDNSDARYRREIVLPFPHQFEDGINADPELLSKIINDEDEMSGIFNLVIDSLKTIHDSKKIHVNSTISQRRAKAELTTDPVKAFLDTGWNESTNQTTEYLTKDEFYNAFTQFCKDNKLYVLSYDAFAKELKKEHRLPNGRKIIRNNVTGEENKVTVWYVKFQKEKEEEED